jgi:predicted dehydrogenase
MESNRIAEEKGLKVVVGFQRRYQAHYVNWAKQIHAGAIGDIQYTRVFWNQGTMWNRHRVPGESELDFQLRNWYHFTWLYGDNICEQHCHNIDIGIWLHGKGDRMAHPVRANGMGGRLHKAGSEHLMRQAPPFSSREAWDAWFWENRNHFPRHGQVWDSFFVEFEYADGSRMYSQCRHIPNAWNIVTEFVYGIDGSGTPGNLHNRGGTHIWHNTEGFPKGGFHWEHDVLVDAIRNDKPLHDGWHAAHACMAAVLGREAAYCGRVVEWNDLVERGRSYFPAGEMASWQDAPVQPDADGFYESTVAVPGQYNPFV